MQGNFVADVIDIEIMQRQYRRWLRAKDHAQGGANADLQAGLEPASGPRSDAQLALGQTADGAAGPAQPAGGLSSMGASAALAGVKLTGDEVAAFGFKYQQAPEHTMFGVLVNPQVRHWVATWAQGVDLPYKSVALSVRIPDQMPQSDLSWSCYFVDVQATG